MIDFGKLCMNCMRDSGGKRTCPHCGYNADTPQLSPLLPVKTVIANRYLIGSCIETNGDGITYSAYDMTGNTPVYIKEFLPVAVTERKDNNAVSVKAGKEKIFRECEQSFIELWSKLARLSGRSAITKVTDLINFNSTHYAVYEKPEGLSLRDYLINSKQGFLTWEKARQLLMPVLSTIGTLHSVGIIHRGISPTTLIVGSDGRIRLTGFCIGQARTAGSELNVRLFEGYSAVEQHGYNGQQGPWTDIYSFGAVLYRTLIGSDPLPSVSRISNDRLMIPARFAEQLPAYVINGLVNSLQILPDDRTRNVEQLRAELSASPSAMINEESIIGNESDSVKKYTSGNNAGSAKPVKKKKKKGSFTALKTAAVCVALGIVLLFVGSYLLPEEYDNYNVVRQVIRELTGKPFMPSPEDDVSENATDINDATVVSVPALEGKLKDEIESNSYILSNFNIVYKEEFSETVAEGVIISQDLTPGGQVKSGQTIVLTVSQGMPFITMPTVVGMQYKDAKKLLLEKGFEINDSSVTYKTNDGAHTEGVVYKTDKASGMEYRKGTVVALVVWAKVEESTTGISGSIVTTPDSTSPSAPTQPIQ